MRYTGFIFAALLLNGCAFISWENGGTSIQYDGSSIWNDGGWLIHQSSAFRQHHRHAHPLPKSKILDRWQPENQTAAAVQTQLSFNHP